MHQHMIKRVGSLALGSSVLLLSMIPAASVFAAQQTNTYITSVTTKGGGLSFSATSMHKPGVHVWYQFRIETNHHWYIAQKFSQNSTFTLPANTQATAVEAFALTQYQVQHKQWQSQVKASNSLPVSKVASISITGTSNASTAAGAEILTVVAQDASGHVIANPGTATWTVTPNSGALIHALTPGTSAAFTATAAGTYTVTVTLDGQTATKTMVVYTSHNHYISRVTTTGSGLDVSVK